MLFFKGFELISSQYQGHVEHWENPLWPYGSFLLRDKDGRSLKRYKRRYNKNVWERLLTAVRHAKRTKEQLTVVGWLEKGRGLELDWIWYDGKTMDTDYVSPLRRSPALGIA